MTKIFGKMMVIIVLFALLLTGCKLPASEAPETPESEGKTTPIVIQTDTEGAATETGSPVSANTATLEGEIALPTATATPEPTEVIPIPTVTAPAQYTLREGEFPFCIARRFDVSIEELLNLNNLAVDELVSPGTTLQIPQGKFWEGDGRVRNPHPTTHTVTAGENIYSIACFYGDVSPEAIIAVNQLEEPYELTPGQSLYIP